MKTILILDCLLLFIAAASVGHAIARDHLVEAAIFTVVFAVFTVIFFLDSRRALK